MNAMPVVRGQTSNAPPERHRSRWPHIGREPGTSPAGGGWSIGQPRRQGPSPKAARPCRYRIWTVLAHSPAATTMDCGTSLVVVKHKLDAPPDRAGKNCRGATSRPSLLSQALRHGHSGKEAGVPPEMPPCNLAFELASDALLTSKCLQGCIC